ncbi:MAG: hypothetical protein WBG90_05100 [Saonia sp.]
MSTATAYEPRPKGTTRKEVTVQLVQAVHDDFKKVTGYRKTGHGSVPIVKLRLGMIYWLYSSSKNEMESTPYIITECTDPRELKEYLDNKMVYIARNPFKE